VRRILLACVTIAGPAAGQTLEPRSVEPWQPPTLTTTRYDEDWSRLADPDERTGRWTEQFKYIPLGPDVFATTGVELRVRNESLRDNLWGGGDAPEDGYQWIRFVPHADVHAGRLRAFVQPIAAYAIGVAPAAGPNDQTRVDLLQGFADLRLGDARTGDAAGTGVTLRAGRQMISLGTERLVGTRYGPNVPLAFDGFRALASLDGATLSLFAVRPVEPGSGSFDDRRSRSRSLWGAYASRHGIDLYYLGYRNARARFGGETGRELRHSVGARVFGARADWHWNAEGIYQFGSFAGQDISAWTLAAETGHRFAQAKWTPDATVRFNIASGDRNPGDGRLGTFNALFPKGKYFGELSPVGPYNIVSVNPRVAASFGSDVTGSLAGMGYWRFSQRDGVYGIPGNLIRPAGRATARFIGAEAEGTIEWQASPELNLSASLSAFAPGEFIRQTGPARTTLMLGLEANFRF
jgi:hypothetical protein